MGHHKQSGAFSTAVCTGRFRGIIQMLCAGWAEQKYSTVARCNCKSQLVPNSTSDCTAKYWSGISDFCTARSKLPQQLKIQSFDQLAQVSTRKKNKKKLWKKRHILQQIPEHEEHHTQRCPRTPHTEVPNSAVSHQALQPWTGSQILHLVYRAARPEKSSASNTIQLLDFQPCFQG